MTYPSEIVYATCGCCGKVMYSDSEWVAGAFCSDTCHAAYNENVDEYLKAKKEERAAGRYPEGRELRKQLTEAYPPIPDYLIDRILGKDK